MAFKTSCWNMRRDVYLKEPVEDQMRSLDRNGYQQKGSSTANLNSCQTAALDIKAANMHTWRFSKTSYQIHMDQSPHPPT
eukprot:6314642-Amphidinium_carterae.1